MPQPKQPVRCLTCFWTGQRATDAAPNTELDKPCPNGHPVVVGPWPPTSTEMTPSGFVIQFWDSENVESGQPQQRRYLVDGQRLPSVTSLLRILDKPALLDWAARLAKEGVEWRDVRDEAGERGHNAHRLVLDVLTGRQRRLSSLPEEHRAYGQAVMAWVASRNPRPLYTEKLVASVQHGYSGRLDLICDLDGGRPIVDYKTQTKWSERDGKRLPPYEENALQLDLYAGAAIESGYLPPEYGLVVRLGPDGQYDETPFELDPARGLAILAAYRAKAEASAALKAGLKPRLAVAA